MADNLTLPATSSVVATKDLAGVHLQKVILVDDGGNFVTVADGATALTRLVQVGGTDGTNAQILKTDASGELQVDVLTLPAVSGTVTANLGTLNGAATEATLSSLDGKVTACNTGAVTISALPNEGQQTMANSISVAVASDQSAIPVSGTVTASNTAGNIAHDDGDSGNPVKVGFKAHNALPTAVANNDRANAIADLFGRLLVSHIDPAMQVWKSANYTGAQTGAAMWTPAGGKKVALTYLAISSYATTAGRVIIWFGASGDTTYSAGTDQLVWAGSFAPSANSKPGAILTFGNAPVFAVTADHVLRITSDAAVSLDITMYGYEF